MIGARAACCAAAIAALAASPAAAHGLIVSIHGDGGVVSGKVYYSDGAFGSDQYAELVDLDDPAAKAQTGKTDAKGAFRFPGVPGHRYRFLTEGEEGHTTEMEITVAQGAKGRFIDRDAVAAGPQAPPAWAVVGGLLALMSVPAVLMRLGRRKP